MSVPTWDGVTTSSAFQEAELSTRNILADAAKIYDWERVLTILGKRQDLVNATRPHGQSHYTVLHQAAHGGAPAEVVQQLIAIGAWRTLRTSQAERAVDIALRQGHMELLPLLTPVLAREIVPTILQAIQDHFHAVIWARLAERNLAVDMRLPELEPLLELERPTMWFPVPGMYGGFSYELSAVAGSPALISESWSRVVGGSGQRHLVSPHGSVLLDEGFV
ncbi:ankyrin repeat domain-containing protein [Chloroflexales bacterium ZM16-3]|nr:ankyrin repeat domain-containing protein [Chloroflexales bacterium ZM16-3]